MEKKSQNIEDQLFGDKKFNVQHPTDPQRNLVDD